MRLGLLITAILLLFFPAGMDGRFSRKTNIGEAGIDFTIVPIFPEKDRNDLITLHFMANGADRMLSVSEIRLKFTKNSAFRALASAYVYSGVNEAGERRCDTVAVSASVMKKTTLKCNTLVNEGANRLIIGFTALPDACLSGTLGIRSVTISFNDGSRKKIRRSASDPEIRFGRVLRAAGQDGCDTYRIPGLITTNAGTLIAVYDNRYRNSKDLQEDIDIGMSRSTDGGQTWEPMKVIMNMGEYGGLPQNLNGIGDPCILYDHFSNTIWVAALWMSGSAPDRMLWWESRPGMTPQETGQFILVKSTDDGVTWSQPLNITEQIKDPDWQLLLQGPGRGITLSDGTLVFPAQYKADIGVKALDGGRYTCHSTIVYSKDGGNSWHIGTGAKPNTTEAQVVELSDGSLMLNMRDDRNRTDKGATNGRAVAITRDMGRTWITHPSSNSALPEPNCMASIISADLYVGGEKKRVLFFSNPDDRSRRIRMTVKTSLDEGMTWPEDNRIELCNPESYGYSCLTMIDDETLGILYEGTKEIFFQRIPVELLIKNK